MEPARSATANNKCMRRHGAMPSPSQFFLAATGIKPLPFQMAWRELPPAPIRTLEAPTEPGKTLTTLVGWLWGRQQKPESTPRGLAYQALLGRRTDQIPAECEAVISRLGLAIPVLMLSRGIGRVATCRHDSDGERRRLRTTSSHHRNLQAEDSGQKPEPGLRTKPPVTAQPLRASPVHATETPYRQAIWLAILVGISGGKKIGNLPGSTSYAVSTA